MGGRVGERRRKTLRVLHLDQGMTDNIPADHLSAPLFDDKAHPPSAIHYRFSLPEARASIMLPLRDAAPPPHRTQAWPSLVGIPAAHHYRPDPILPPPARRLTALPRCFTPAGSPSAGGLGPDPGPDRQPESPPVRWMIPDILVPGSDF